MFSFTVKMILQFLLPAVISLLLPLLCISIYRRYFSPLAQAGIPGPFLYSISRLPLVYHSWRGMLPFKILELHDKYGPVVRLAPDEVSFISDVWNDIYGRQQNRPQLRKDPLSLKGPKSGTSGLLYEQHDHIHARLRRNFSHAFSEQSMHDQEPLIRIYIDLLIRKLHGNAGRKINIANWYKFTTFDVMGDLVFGESFDGLQNAALHTWIQDLFDWVFASTILGMIECFWPWTPLLSFFVPRHMKAADGSHRAKTQIRLDRRLANTQPRVDLITHVQNLLDKPTGLKNDELLETCRVLVAAGSETTATLLTGLTYYLLANPSVYEKLVKEIRDSFRNANEINMQSVQNLGYQLAVIKEALRLFPPIPGNLRRMTPSDGWWITGQWIPGDVAVAIDMYAANHSETNFTRPKEFLPERWLSDAPIGLMQNNCKIVKAFSHGPRNCPGKSLAYMEIRLILARVLFEFDLQLQQESRDWLSRLKVFGRSQRWLLKLSLCEG